MGIRLESLGGLKVFRDKKELTEFPHQRLRCALLLYVAVEREATRDRLIELIWPTENADRARRRLSQMIYELKQALGAEWLELGRDELVATAELTTDVQELQRCLDDGTVDQVGGLYHGPFLGRHALVTTPAFEHWVDARRTRCQSLYRQAQHRYLDWLLERDDVGGALAAARRWVFSDPEDDDANHRLIALLARCGLRNEALRQFEEHRERLSWIDAEPLPATLELVEAVKSGDVEVDVSPRDRGYMPAAPAKTGVVVFPILNYSSDPSKQYLCDGLAEEIMHALGRVPRLRVAPRTSAFALHRAGVRVSVAARELGVAYALEGSAGFFGERYRVDVKLIEGVSETVLWDDRFDGTLATTDVLELQDQIAEAVLDALGPHLGTEQDGAESPAPRSKPRSGQQRATADPEAFDLYLKGRHAWFGRSAGDLARALDLFKQAAERDPSYAQAHAGIADVYLVLGGLDYAIDEPAALYGPAREAAERALALDPELAEAHAAMGNYLLNHAWDWDAAGERFRRAIELSPRYSPGRQWYSNYLMCLGRADEAVDQAKMACAADPLSAFLPSTLARHYQLMRQPDRATEEFKRALDLDPTLVSARIGLALAELQRGDPVACLDRMEKVAANLEREVPLVQAMLAYAAALAGDADRARALIDRLRGSAVSYLPPEYVAVAYIGLGDHDAALNRLGEALRMRSQALTLLKVEPIFDPLRRYPRFASMLAAVGLAD